MLKKIDWWIGDHMSAERWIIVWLVVFGLGISMAVGLSVAWKIVGGVLASLGAIGVYGNTRRVLW